MVPGPGCCQGTNHQSQARCAIKGEFCEPCDGREASWPASAMQFQTHDKDRSQFYNKQTPQPRSLCLPVTVPGYRNSQPQWNTHWFSARMGRPETWRNGKCSWDLRTTREEQTAPSREDCSPALPEPRPPRSQHGSQSSSTLSCGLKRKENICTQTCA